MTIEEARNIYGDENGYVVCVQNCPCYPNCKLLHGEIAGKHPNGLKNCWEHIAAEMTKRENTAAKTDDVTHPDHYKGEKYECIEVMLEVFGADAVKDFCLCNAFKYLWRCKKKHDSAVTDIKKAKFYLEKYIELEEGEANMNGK